jgi:MtaA/CmuA family methyltransferase
MLGEAMNGYRRIHAALRGQRPDLTPVMLHNFMMAAFEAGVSMRRYRTEPAEIARCFIEAVEKYEYDGIVVDVDTATLAGAVGVPVMFPDDEPAIYHGRRLRSLDEARDLEPADVGRYPGIQVWLEAVRLLKRHFGDEVYLRGNCDQAPFALACAMRGSAEWMMDLMDPANEEDAGRLLEFSTDATIQFIRLMAAAGAHMVSNGDSSAGPSVISPRLYRKFALPYEKRVVEAAHGMGLPYMLHICGKTEPILDGMVSTGADALELDYKTDARCARDILGGRVTFTGNIDPSGVLALGTPREVERKTRELLEVFAGTPRFILNAGCAIPSTTPPDNIRAMIKVAREGSQEEHHADHT